MSKKSMPCEEYGSKEVQRITDRVAIHREDVTGRRFVVYEIPGMKGWDEHKVLRACQDALLQLAGLSA